MYYLRGLKFNPDSGLKAEKKIVVESKERKNNLVITKEPTFFYINRLRPIKEGAVQTTFANVSLPICDFNGLKILAG